MSFSAPQLNTVHVFDHFYISWEVAEAAIAITLNFITDLQKPVGDITKTMHMFYRFDA